MVQSLGFAIYRAGLGLAEHEEREPSPQLERLTDPMANSDCDDDRRWRDSRRRIRGSRGRRGGRGRPRTVRTFAQAMRLCAARLTGAPGRQTPLPGRVPRALLVETLELRAFLARVREAKEVEASGVAQAGGPRICLEWRVVGGASRARGGVPEEASTRRGGQVGRARPSPCLVPSVPPSVHSGVHSVADSPEHFVGFSLILSVLLTWLLHRGDQEAQKCHGKRGFTHDLTRDVSKSVLSFPGPHVYICKRDCVSRSPVPELVPSEKQGAEVPTGWSLWEVGSSVRGHQSWCLSLDDSPTFLSTPTPTTPTPTVVFTHFPVEQL